MLADHRHQDEDRNDRANSKAGSSSQPQQSGTSGTLEVVFNIGPVPDDPDPDNFELYDNTTATGDWDITVTVDPQGIRDQGNDWTLVVAWTFYEGRLIERPDEGAS